MFRNCYYYELTRAVERNFQKAIEIGIEKEEIDIDDLKTMKDFELLYTIHNSKDENIRELINQIDTGNLGERVVEIHPRWQFDEYEKFIEFYRDLDNVKEKESEIAETIKLSPNDVIIPQIPKSRKPDNIPIYMDNYTTFSDEFPEFMNEFERNAMVFERLQVWIRDTQSYHYKQKIENIVLDI